MNDVLAFFIGLVIGVAGGAVAMWSTLYPAAEAARLRASTAEDRLRVVLLERKAN